MTSPITWNLLHPPADIGIVIAMSVKGHQIDVTASSMHAGTARFRTITEGTYLAVIGRAIEKEVSDIIVKGTLPEVVVGKLA